MDWYSHAVDCSVAEGIPTICVFNCTGDRDPAPLLRAVYECSARIGLQQIVFCTNRQAAVRTGT